MRKICSKCNLELDIDNFSCTKRNEDDACKYYNSWCNNCRSLQNSKRLGLKRRLKPLITETEKQCLKCLNLFDFSNFYPSKRGRLGLSSYCKTCTPRMIPEKSRKHVNKYRQSNRERYLSLHRLHMFARRNNIKIKSDGTVTDDFLRFVYSQTTCCWCNNEIQPKDRTLEHIIELSSGGLHSVHNITMACRSCNSARLNKNNDRQCDSLFSKFIETEKENDNFS